jgi:hypothetical protein
MEKEEKKEEEKEKEEEPIDKVISKYQNEYNQIIAFINHYTERKNEIENNMKELDNIKIKLKK